MPTLGNLNVATCVYDGDGRRVEKLASTARVRTYVYDAAGQLAAGYSGDRTGTWERGISRRTIWAGRV
jgi:YD repeat-containing protein